MDISSLVFNQKEYFKKGETKSIAFRVNQLQSLKHSIQKNEKNIINALKKDLNKSEKEAYMTEIGVLLEEISFMIKHLRKWMKPKRAKTPITHFGAKSIIYPEPYGTVLIIAPWNYPFQLAISPLIGAIAAGNTAIIKPSELTPNVSRLLSKIMKDTFRNEYITVVEGGVDASQALLQENFDYIFFTGSVPVGKIIMKEASKHLTPVTLELGGKSPVIVDHTANLDLAAKRIVWGKFLNAGQTCIAPDYLFVHDGIKDTLIDKMKLYINNFYGKSPLDNEQYSSIVNERHFHRVSRFLQDGKIIVGGEKDVKQLKISPTIMDEVTWDDPVMQEEIFGPVLPILSFTNLEEVINTINSHPKPLALYLFTENHSVEKQLLSNVSFGGGCINDTILHVASPYLPFGGVGNSGIGSYHGKKSFDTFTHYKSVLKQTTLFDISLRYPNAKNALKWIRLLLK